jgi:hypothetical protein
MNLSGQTDAPHSVIVTIVSLAQIPAQGKSQQCRCNLRTANP